VASKASERQPALMIEPGRDKDAPELDVLRPALTTLAAMGGRAESAGRMWILLLALLLRFRRCFRGFGLVRA
jgi:hypothetical protein